MSLDRHVCRGLSVLEPNVLTMRILHTSDWHIGRTFHGQDLLADQEFVLSALADLAAEHRVDLVIVAGDIYDRAVPSAESVQVATRILTRLRAAGAIIVASSGNHDSAPRLGAFSDFLAAGGLHLRTSVAGIGRPIMLDDQDGPVAIYPMPYLEPEVVKVELGVPGRPGHQAVVAAAMDAVRADLAGRPTGTRSVVSAHAFVVGGYPGGSERSIAVGGVESVSAEVFDGIDYVALGHLHGAQKISDRMRYSGSPLPYSFGEAGHRKGAWLIDLGADGDIAETWIDLPVVRPLAEVSGTLDEVLVGYGDLTDHYLAVVLTDVVRPLDPMRRLRERFPFTLTVTWEPAGSRPLLSPARITHGVTDDADIVADFLLECRGRTASATEQVLIDRACAAERILEVSA